MADHAVSPEDKAEREKFEAEDDVRTLTRAEEIKTDKPRHRRAMKMAREKMKELDAVGAKADG